MNNSLFYNHVDKNDLNEKIIKHIEDFADHNPTQQIYLLTSPLGEKYAYEYEENAVVLLSPNHKIIFIDLKGDSDKFNEYYDDFIEDLNSISDKFNYKDYIGRPRDWKSELTVKVILKEDWNISNILRKHALSSALKRKSELLISLLIGSINDIEKVGADIPETLLDKVKKNIILFDGDQTRFIYQDFRNKTVSIQGLSGTGKTELLLHKLKELYISSDNNRIFFTCHNIALANTLRERIPSFFNFMRVEKQIEWNSRLWVNRAWGSRSDKNSGLYSYLCDFYDIPFLRYSPVTDYETIFKQALNHINQIDENKFEFAFDYILIDERQDFPKVFFDLCEKIAKEKVYIAGDIFQDIYDRADESVMSVDVILNRCYRTDPRTLMFAHAIGMGLFEKTKLNWFKDPYWETIGYKMERYEKREVHLSREPIRRFEDLNLEKLQSMIIEKSTHVDNVIRIIGDIKKNNPSVKADDIAIILLDDNKTIYDYIDTLSYKIMEKLQWKVNRAYESKSQEIDAVYVTNPNNVKGLEFPFVICITSSIKRTYKYRNILYTMLTRSFIQSYLLIEDASGIENQEIGLKLINTEGYIKTIEPTKKEKEQINQKLIKLQSNKNISYKDFLNGIFKEVNLPISSRQKMERAILLAEIEKFDKEQTIKFINANKEFYGK